MIHYGDITKISGYDVPIVDCVVGGSPCQDLSVAGKRAGLDGERSGLFMEQIRITKEMRDKDERCNGRSGVNVRPRFFIWENVPGAFSSNKGEDFRIVLEEIAKIVDKDAVIPMPESTKNKWTTSGTIVGDGWSIAWRILDAQFWGVPQRRRRITLIADFGGQCAQEILFERRCLQGHTEESRTKGQGITKDAQGCFGVYDSNGRESVAFEPGIASREGGHIYENVSGTLRSNMGDNQMSVAYCYDIGDRRSVANESVDVSPTLLSKMSTGGNNVPVVVEGLDVYNQTITGDKSKTLMSKATDSDHIPCIVMDRASYNQGINADAVHGIDENGVAFSHIATGPGAVCYVVDQGGEKSGANVTEGITPTLTCTHGGEPVVCLETFHCVTEEGTSFPLKARDYKDMHVVAMATQQGGAEIRIDDKCPTLTAAAGMSGNNQPVICYKQPKYIVRRLTPLECERLQGYPDGWTDIGEYIDSKGKKKKSSDSARYKALGNSIALPPWKWVIKRLCSHYERDATLCSLFDGIGGFPYVWEQINGKGSCLWASEIEDFPIAVTKKRIG